jgi:phosphoadenosine phosphosulfate reductase
MNCHNPARTYWCDNCQVPLLGPICLLCGQSARDVSSSNLRPVFGPELDYLEKMLGGELRYCLEELETWVNPSSKLYFISGKPAFKLSGPSKVSKQISCKVIGRNLSSTTHRPANEIIDTIRKANLNYLKDLQYETESFIKETTEKYSNRTVFVSFSGGKDSTVVSHLVMNAFGRSDVLHVFADTTIEAPDTYAYMESFKKTHSLTPLIQCQSSLDFFDIADQIGAPSRILRWCCATHKTNPLSKIIGVLNPSSGVLAFDGVRRSESHRRSKYNKVSLNHKVGREILASPILEWSETQLWIYILSHGLTINNSYAKGFRRVGCLYCPFNSNWSELLIEHYYPDKHSAWIEFLRKHAKQIRHPEPEVYVERGWRVRAGGRGLDSYKTVLDSYPCALSENAFNYQLIAGNVRDVELFLRPFGPQLVVSEDNYSKSFIIKDKTDQMLATVELSYEENTVRVNYTRARGRHLFKKRVEKQLRKLQSCINCGSCMAKCPVKTYDSEGAAGILSINVDQCTSCLKCVSYRCPVVDSLTRKGRG